MNLILQAAAFANNAHRGVMRKWSDQPYIVHPMRVAGMISLVPGVNEQIVAAAWLHDVIEDCPAQVMQFYASFGKHKQLVETVESLTNRSKSPEHKGKSREEKKRIDREYLATCGLWVKVLKLTDRLDNLRDMGDCERVFRRMYSNESVLLAEALKPGADVPGGQYDFTIGPGCDSRIVELERLYHAVKAEGQKFF